MRTEHSIELDVQVAAENATDEDIDRMTRQLLSELREKGIEFEGSPEELQKLLAALEKGKKKK